MKKIIIALLVSLVTVSATSCMPYDTPEFQMIEPSQTAFLVPLIGDSEKQDSFESEDLLNKMKVATKEIQIPHRWVQTGRASWMGKHKPSARLIIVERKPETREWTTDRDSGTSSKNEGIQAKTKDNIKFTVNIACTAQIDEINAAKFLYRYNNKSLADIMDNEIKTKITTAIISECAKYNQDETTNNTKVIMGSVSNEIIPYFYEKGITITAFGLTSDFVYSEDIQRAIDSKFKTEKEAEAQRIENEQAVENAKSEVKIAELEAEALKKREEVIDSQIEIKKIENQSEWIKKWDGKVPQIISDGNNMYYGIN